MNKKKLGIIFMTGILAASLTACQSKDGTKSDNTKVEEDGKGFDENDDIATRYDFNTDSTENILGSASQSTSDNTSNNTPNNTSESASDNAPDSTSESISQNTISGSLLNITSETSGDIFFSDITYLEEDELQYIPSEILRIARNEIYARHGYQFTSDMKNFFENKEWYNGTISPSDWSDSKLNTYEKKNVKLIRKYENKGAVKPLQTTITADNTVVKGEGFELTLTSAWNDSTYFVIKSEQSNGSVYSFYSKNNFAYGFGGHVFSLFVFNTSPSDNDLDFCDNTISLGNNGSKYYVMAQSTDVQYGYNIPELSSEWDALNGTYRQIADSFQIQ